MKNLKAKLRKQGGFTLVEMLIVVAIIGILIAVSIPAINSALEGTRHATDSANERAAKAVALVHFLNGEFGASGSGKKYQYNLAYPYDAKEGKLKDDTTATYDYGKHVEHEFIKVSVSSDGEATVTWNKTKSTVGTSNTLCGETPTNHNVTS